ncbi:MAG TPA: ATP-binding protein [Flavobacteriales bacterium]|nr:ATP-binding protein [Flavobacteriales bacterium]
MLTKFIHVALLFFILLTTGLTRAAAPGPLTFANRTDAIRYIDSLNEQAYKIASGKVHLAGAMGKQTLFLSEKYLYPVGKIYALNNISIAERNQGNYAIALKFLKKALVLAYKANDKLAIGRCYYNLGDLNKILANYPKATYYFQQSFYLFKQARDYHFASMALSNLAHTNVDKALHTGDTSNFARAKKLYLASIKVGQDHNLPQRVSVGYINLSNLYNVFGHQVNNANYFPISLDYSKKAYAIAQQYGFVIDMAISLNNIGEMLESRNLYDSALVYYLKAMELYEKNGENNWIVFIHSQIGHVYILKKQYPQAIRHLEYSLEVAKKENFKHRLLEVHERLAEVYSMSGQHEKAFDSYKLSSVYKDSIAVEKSNIALAGLQIEFEAEQKDKEIALLNKNKEIQNQALKLETIYRNMLIVGCCLLSLLLIWVDYRYREKQRNTNKILKAKEEAERAKEVQEQFLTNTSHEIRTPMNGVLGMTNYLLSSDLSEKQREYVNAIHESANSLLVIINDLLDMSKIKAGKMSFVQKPFTIKSLFKNLSLILDDKIREKDIALELVIDENVPVSVIGDRVRVQQVLLNLAGNAVKFTQRGKISVHVKHVSTVDDVVTLSISVGDTGVGIPPENISSIFESFTQVDAKRNRKHGGTGLGLSISKQLVEQMGGQISVESKPGEGSVFTFTLGFKINHSSPVETPVQRALKAGINTIEKNHLPGVHVLVVDDNKINRQVAKLTLERWFIQVSLAESGKQAIEWLSKYPKVDLILMDITMPEMDGFETTAYIRTKLDSPLKNIPVVAMTASAFPGEKDKCLAMGLNDYISKPFKPVELFELVKKNLPGHFNQQKSSLIDLSALLEKADGNMDFLADIMETYVNEMPGYLDELNDAFGKKDLKAVREQAHKMKSPTALFGAMELKDHLHFVELNIENSGCTIELNERLERINSLGNLSISEVKAELNKVSQPVN